MNASNLNQLDVNTRAGSKGSGQKPSQATELVVLAEKSASLVHDNDSEAYCVAQCDGHQEVWPLASKHFKRWISKKFFQQHKTVPSSQALKDATNVLEGKAVFEGEKHYVHVRCAEHDGKVYIDLCNSDWQVVEIDASGWRLVSNSPVLFRRAKAMQPLPTPVENGDINELRSFVNVSDEDWPLLLAWLVAAVRPTGPYPVLAVHGEHGSAKSTLCKYVRRLVDPNTADLRADYREPRDLMICANNGWVIALDNVSRIPAWLSDCFCRLATGGGFSTRTLFANDEETIFNAQRPLVLNCIEEVVTRSDLLDRSLLLNLPRIEEDKRVEEKSLDARFKKTAPRILGGLLDAVSCALARRKQVKLSRLPRMADFAIWATAAEPAIGLSAGEFMAAYRSNRDSGNDTAIESSPVGRAVLEFIAEVAHWEGTSTDLLKDIEARVDDKTRKLKSWPSTARALGAAVKRIAPNLRTAGVDLEFGRTGRKRTITLTRQTGEFCVTNVTNVTTPEKQGSSCDARVTQNESGDANEFSDVTPKMPLIPEENSVGDANDNGDAKILTQSSDAWGEL